MTARRKIAKISVSDSTRLVALTYAAALQVSLKSDGEAPGAKTRTTTMVDPTDEAPRVNTRKTQLLDGEALGAKTPVVPKTSVNARRACGSPVRKRSLGTDPSECPQSVSFYPEVVASC